MIKLPTYNSKGIKAEDTLLPRKFETKVNKILLAQAIRVYENRLHPGLSKTKTRGEVKASTKKIYRQKGTGGARHGARSAPIFVGGGKAHGPKGVKRTLVLSKKMRRKATAVAISLLASDQRLFVLKDVFALKKTKTAVSLIEKILKSQKIEKKNPSITFWFSNKNIRKSLYLRNIKNVVVKHISSINAYDVYFSGISIIDKDSIAETKGARKVSRVSKKS